MEEIGIYVHIPFCKQKCNYCDFNSFANKGEYIEKYIRCMQKEIKNVGDKIRLNSNGDYTNLPLAKTLYIGGGTPSFIDEKYIEGLEEESKSSNLPQKSYSNLNPKYTFETFVVGNNNRFAHAAALAVGNEPGKAYNPLFL